MKFSVVMSVYIKDNDFFLKKSLESLVSQTLLPDEIILVADGALKSSLYKVISNYRCQYDFIKFISYEENKGPAYAWNIAIENSNNDWIARMDADDICEIDRFEKQVYFLKNNPKVQLLGGHISEFYSDESISIGFKRAPIGSDSIVKFSKKRNPFNHVTVMFRKDLWADSGKYIQISGFVDYYLWIRILSKNTFVANLDTPLVKVRVGNDMFGRRVGWGYLKNEIKFMYSSYEIGYISFYQMLKNLTVRIPLRLLPTSIVEILYKFR